MTFGLFLKRTWWFILPAMMLVACGGASVPPATVLPPSPSTVAQSATPTSGLSLIAPPTPDTEKNLVICTPTEPTALFWTQTDLAARTILDTVREPLIDQRDYGYRANLVERVPSFENGDAILRDVIIGEGNVFFDLLSQRPLILSRDLQQPFALYQRDGEPLYVERWAGQELLTVQTVVRWRLMPGLQWQDGVPVTAYDSLYAFQLTLDEAWQEPDPRTARTATYTALDDRTLEWAGLPGYADATYFLNVWDPIPRHLYGDKSVSTILVSTEIKRRPWSYGPYMITAWNRGETLVLERNPYYVKGTPPIARITFRFINNPDEVLDLLVSGGCDIATQNSSYEKVYDRIENLVRDERILKQDVPGAVFEHLDFNLQPAPEYQGAAATLRDNTGGLLFQNPKFRAAVALCIDRERLADENANGAAFVRYGYMGQSHLLYPGDGQITVHSFNPMAGRQFLEELGWRDTNNDLILDNGAGTSLQLRYSLRRDAKRVELASQIKDQLRLFCGIDIVMDYHGAEFFDDGPIGVVFGRRYDLAEFGWMSTLEPPCYLYLTSQIPNEFNGWGASNNTGYSNADFDNACTRALSTLDEDGKAAAHAEALAIFTRDLPSIPLFTRTVTVLYRPEVVGVDLDPTAASELWNIENFDVK
jgi:peptide/nickel transport system substrate-binding protein